MTQETRPIERLLRPAEVMAIVGLKETQLHEKVANGEFPPPLKITDSGRLIAWPESEIRAWVAGRISAPRALTQSAGKAVAAGSQHISKKKQRY